MLRSDGKRPDGTTLIPWRAGRNLVWDATVVDTLAPSYLQATAVTAGAAAEIADNRKNHKYQTLLDTHVFIPLALETLGPINLRGLELITDTGRRLVQTYLGKNIFFKICCSTRLPLLYLTRRLCVDKIEEIGACLEVARF